MSAVNLENGFPRRKEYVCNDVCYIVNRSNDKKFYADAIFVDFIGLIHVFVTRQGHYSKEYLRLSCLNFGRDSDYVCSFDRQVISTTPIYMYLYKAPKGMCFRGSYSKINITFNVGLN